MATLNSYKEVVQVGEDMEYPDGYNCVEITGTGDERTLRVFPKIAITGPVTMSSDGKTLAQITVNIYDPNVSNPFRLDPHQFEEVTPSDPLTLTVSNWITTLHGVWEDAEKTRQVPPEYIIWKEDQIQISDRWKSSDAPAVWSGFYSQRAYVEYDGQYTMTVADGKQTKDRWWDAPAADTDDDTSVTGLIFLDDKGLYECTSGAIGIPNTTGQTTTLYFWYRPDEGDDGTAYINVEWAESTAAHTIEVTRGSYVGCSLTLTPDPSSLPAGVAAESVCTFEAYDRNGYPLLGATVDFYVQSGGGHFIEGDDVPIEEVTDQDEEQNSDNKTQVNMSHPILRVNSIEVIGTSTFVWNGQCTISKNKITLIDQQFDDTNNITPLTINYDWGGQCNAIYKSSTASKVGDEIIVGATLGGGVNTLATITISEQTGGPSLNIDAISGSLTAGGSTPVVATGEDSEGNAIRSGIVFSVVPSGGGTLSMAYDRGAITGETGSISDRKTCSVQYTIDSVQKVVFEGDEYTVGSFEGNTITISGDFGVAEGNVTVDYTPKGKWTGTYTCPATVTEPFTAYLNAFYSDSGGEDLATDTVDIEGGGPKNIELTVTAEKTTITAGTRTGITATLKADGSPYASQNVVLKIIDGPGTLAGAKEVVRATDVSGIATASFYAGTAGTTKIQAIYKTESADTSVTVEPIPKTVGDDEVMTLSPVTISGEVDPAKKTFTLTNGATVKDFGIAANADEFGCIDGDPAAGDWNSMCKIFNTKSNAMVGSIVSVSVSGGTLEGGLLAWQRDPRFLSELTIAIPWQYELNAGRNQTIHVVDKFDENVPVVGAQVSMGGQSAVTDTNGIATFTGLGAGTYQVSITHPNYKDNRAGVVGGTGVYDSDTTNDQYVVRSYSNRLYKLKKLTVNISITYTVKKEYYWDMIP